MIVLLKLIVIMLSHWIRLATIRFTIDLSDNCVRSVHLQISIPSLKNSLRR